MIDIATDSSEKVVKDLEVRGIISIFAEIIQLSQAKLASVERGKGRGARSKRNVGKPYRKDKMTKTRRNSKKHNFKGKGNLLHLAPCPLLLSEPLAPVVELSET